MTLSAADIVNRAIQLVGGYNNQGPVTGSPPSFDGSTVGNAAGILYDGVVQTVSRQFGWDFSRNVADLELTGNAAELGFAFEYQYPTTGVQLRQVFDPLFDRFDPKPSRWTVGSADGGASPATGYIYFPANPSPGETITLNGAVFTFVAAGSTPTNFQSNIGFNLGGTIGLLLGRLPPNGYLTTPQLTVASYSNGNPYLQITYNTLGVSGNSYTLAASAATPSAATLTGGSDALQRVIWTDIADAKAVYTGQPPESAWDAIFVETVVRLLASELDLGLASKPESSSIAFTQAGQFAQLGGMRSDT